MEDGLRGRRALGRREHSSWPQQKHGRGEGANLPLEKVDEILYDGPYALTDSSVATMFMYGELSGMTFPMTAEGPATGGVQTVWNDAHVANMYGLSELDASC